MLQSAARLLQLRIAAHWIAPPQPGVDGSGKSPDVNGKNWQRSPLRTIEQLTSTYREGYNLGIHCGFVEGALSLVWLDLDSEEAIAAASTLFPATPLKTKTRKGEHWGYLHPGKDIRVPNTGFYAAVNGVRTQMGHVRGDGGNIVCAPSIHESGFSYQEITPWSAELLANVPQWNSAIVLDPWRVVTPSTKVAIVVKRNDTQAKNWAQVALDELCGEITATGEGNRNVALNGSAYRAGRLIAGGYLSQNDVERRLAQAASNAGLNTSEIRKTLASGLSAGGKHAHPGPQEKEIKEPKATTYICAAILTHGAIALGTAKAEDFSDPLEKDFIQFISSTDPKEFEKVPAEWDAIGPRTTVAKALEYVEGLISSRPPPNIKPVFNENPVLPRTQVAHLSSAAPDDADFKDTQVAAQDHLDSISHNQLAIEMLNRICVETGGYKAIFADGNFWKYVGGIWEKHTPDMVALALDGISWGTKLVKGSIIPMGHFCMRKTDLIGILDIAKRRVIQDDFFSGIPGIGFENGFAQIAEQGIILREHSPFYRARYKYPFEYNPNWQCSRWGRTLGQLFAPDHDAEDRKKVLQEFAGACLTGVATKYQKFLVLTGKPGCGKSVIFKVLQSIFPDGSVSIVAPQDMGIEYRRVAIVGKLLNCRDDINENSISDVGDVKNVVVGGAIQVRDVGEKQYDTKPIAGHMYAFNNTPRFHDSSGAFTDRIIAIECTRRFRDTPNDNKHLVEEILAEEKDQIIAWALEGAWRLWYQGGYTIPQSSRDCAERWSSANDPVQKFVDEKIDTRLGFIRTVEVYEVYVKWAKACGYWKVHDLHTFIRTLGNHAIVQGDHVIGKLI